MSWQDDALCKGLFSFFNEDYENRKLDDDGVSAKLICSICPVRGRCFDAATQRIYPENAGIWGGFNFAERNKIMKKFAASSVSTMYEKFVDDVVGEFFGVET